MSPAHGRVRPFGGPATGPGRGPLYAATALGVGLLVIRVANAWGLPLPGCGFRAATGVPCVGCGSTRAALALSRGEWLAALVLNPAVVLASLGIGAVFLVWLADTACGTRGMGVIRRHLSGARLAWSVGAGLVLNWIYLLLVRPS